MSVWYPTKAEAIVFKWMGIKFLVQYITHKYMQESVEKLSLGEMA